MPKAETWEEYRKRMQLNTPSPERERWTINVCPTCGKALMNWPPERECQCEPPPIGISTHREVEVVPADRLSRVEEALRDIDARAKEIWRDGSAKDPTTRAYRARSMGMTEAGQILREALVPHPEDTGRCEACGSYDPRFVFDTSRPDDGPQPAWLPNGERNRICLGPFHGQAGS